MERDVMYYFDKNSPYARHELGEIQTNFNFGLTIDGAKDSAQIQVFSFLSEEMKPNTIIFHKSTNTWWVVSRDIVKRYANEKDYYYTHNLSLTGAIELTNVRDLTDSGFNDNTYTIDQFIKRLFKLSTFEFPLTIDYGNNVDENKVVDYIKSFENYTLLSALREFLNGYNCDCELSFNTTTSGNDTFISSATLIVIPRTGNVDLEMLDIDEFDDIRETKTINKESYGTTVVSNAQNVTSTLAKTYPQVGGIKLSSDNFSITKSNSLLRLPTPVFKVNWIKLLHTVKVSFTAHNLNPDTDELEIFPWNNVSLESSLKKIAKYLADKIARTVDTDYTRPPWQEVYDYVMSQRQLFFDKVKKASSITLETGWSIQPYLDGSDPDQHLIAPPNNPTFRFRTIRTHLSGFEVDKALLIGSKEDRESVTWGGRCMYYERGSNEINGFEWIGNVGSPTSGAGILTYKHTDLSSNNRAIFDKDFGYGVYDRISLELKAIVNFWDYGFSIDNSFFQVNYVPMSDIKIKYDNSRNDKDIKLYNQNGKLNDSVALSKLVDSYSKEIQSDNITRYMHYTDFSAIPQVGQLVNNNGEIYVINNISYDFFANEQISDNELGYYIECEFSMSKYISTKSLMVNPNSNIRDYGIPQKYNVKRRQTYRDYFEFSLTEDELANQDTPYVALDKYLYAGSDNVSREYDHTAFIKVDYHDSLNNSRTWFYQLNTTAYVMNKSVYELIDFNDNNIIGYDMQNVWTGFTMSKLFNNNWKSTNIPISYVDEKGKLEGITLQFVGKENTYNLYEKISVDQNNFAMFGSHCFVGSEFYYGKYQDLSETRNVFFNGSGNITYENNETKVRIALTDLLESTEREDIDYSSVVVNSFLSTICYWFMPIQEEFEPQRISMTISSYQIVEDNGAYYLEITDSTGDYSNANSYAIVPNVTYTYTEQVYQGAIELKDYEIKELDYDKDAIEVPVFEYILQLGDTEEVEVGDRILDTGSGLLQMYSCDLRQANTTTQLNASKVFQGLDVTGDSLTGNENYDRAVFLEQRGFSVDVSFEENNTKMRIKVYQSQEATFYGNVIDQETGEQQFAYQGTQVSQNRVPKSQLIGKDIVIYKNIINSMTYDISEDVATCDYNNELMFIIHNPQEDNFDGDDLIVNINHYKLK